MIQNIGYKTYIVFMCFCIVGLLYSIFILPELKGLSLEEVDKVGNACRCADARSSTTPQELRTPSVVSVLPARSVSTRSHGTSSTRRVVLTVLTARSVGLMTRFNLE